MTTSTQDLTLSVSRVIHAPVERVFDAWLDPAMLMRFMCPGPGMTTPRADVTPQVGGRFDLIMKNGDTELPHGGVYRVIDRHTRIVFSWESPFPAEGSTVTLDFKPQGGNTQLTLTHVRFPNEESRDNHQSGWTAILARLADEMSAA